MTNLQKEQVFLEVSSEHNDCVDIQPVGNQSVRLTLPCGCIQTQHMMCGRREDPEQQSIRFQHFQFCNTHINRTQS